MIVYEKSIADFRNDCHSGVIIGKDLKYRDGHLVFDKLENAKTDKYSGTRNLDDETAARLIRNTYKVLLIRGIYEHTYIAKIRNSAII